MKQKKRLSWRQCGLLPLLFLMLSPLRLWAQEPYAVLSDNNTVLTFYYDDQKSVRNGMDVGPFSGWPYDCPSWHLESITNVIFDVSFANCTSLTSTANWFYGCDKLTTITGMEYLNTASVTDMRLMFSWCSSLKSLDLSHFNTANVTDMSGMFFGCSSLTSLDLSNFNTENVRDMGGYNYGMRGGMFQGCSSLTNLDVSNFNTANVMDMSYMFKGCSSLASLNLSSFNTANVTDMGEMFWGCSSLTNLDLSNFNTESVTDMHWMFCCCSSLMSLDVSSFNTANVADMNWMFIGCSSLTSLDLNNFNTAKVKDMSEMFEDCSVITAIYVGNEWSTANVTSGDGVFTGCTKLVGGNGTTYDASHIDYTYARIDRPGEPGYLTDKNAAPVVADAEPYAVLSDDNTVLTFYYDDQKSARNGMDVGPFPGFPNYQTWYSNVESITKVVFDASFANCVSLTSTAYWFCNCRNLTTIMGMEYLNTANVKEMSGMFYSCSNLKDLDFSSFNTENVTKMDCMFWGCSGLTSLDLSNFNTANVTGMGGMFSGCSSLTSLDLSNFNTSNVMSMIGIWPKAWTEYWLAGMFSNCSSLTSLDLSNFDMANVTDMSNMFSGCSNLTSLNVSSFNTANVKNMYRMFFRCSSLTSLDLSSFSTANVTDIGWMFSGCSNLTTIFVKNEWSTANVTEDSGMFTGCAKLIGGNGTTYDADHTDYLYARIDKPGEPGYFTDKNAAPVVADAEPYAVLSDNNTVLTFYYDDQKVERDGMDVGPFKGYPYQSWYSNVESITNVVFDASLSNCTSLTSTAYWFYKCCNLTAITGIEYLNTTNVTDMRAMFCGCSGLPSLDLSNFNTANVTGMGSMFDGCSSIASLDLSNFNTANVTGMGRMFEGCSSLASLDLSNFNTTNVTEMSYMFYGCSSLPSLEVSNFNATNLTSMHSMFNGCSGLTSLDLSNFNTANVTDMSYIFEGCSSLTSLDVSNFNTANVTDMGYMFSGCSSLTSLDVSNFNTANVTNMEGMFDRCSSLTSLDLSNFNTVNVTEMIFMFYGCSSLTSLDVSNFNTANVTEMKGMFSYCSSLTSIDLSNFNTANVTDMRWVFSNCSSLTTIFVRSEWDTANVTDGVGMFLSCAKLIGGNGTVYDENHVDYTYARIDKPGEPGYFTDKNAITETVAVPQFTVEGNRVFIHTATEQAVIYYTLDGSVPNENSTVYKDSIVVDRNCTIKAIAMRENYIPSPVATFEVDWFSVQTDTLILDLAYDGRAVTMTSNNDATIYYTLDGTEPTNRSATYDGKAVMLTGFCTVKAFATAEGKEPTEVMTYVVNSYFDGVTARVREGGSVDEAFQWCGGIGRAEGLAAIVWTCNEPFPQTAATVVRNPNLLLYVNDAKLAPSGITNVVADGRAQQILLTDNLQGDGTHGPAGFHVPQPFHVEGIISYSRTFSQTTGLLGDCRGWETIALPFTVQHFEHETQGECAPFAAGEKDKRSFWLCELTEQGFRDAASLRANTPYIIAMPENEAYARKYRLAGRVTFSASDTDVPATDLETAHRGEASFVPCFSHQTASAAIYALNVGEERSGYAAGSVFENSYRDVWPFEAYRTTAQDGVRRLPIADDLDGTTRLNNEVGIDINDSYYNLQGLPVKAPGKGVYIKGKQKVVFK